MKLPLIGFAIYQHGICTVQEYSQFNEMHSGQSNPVFYYSLLRTDWHCWHLINNELECGPMFALLEWCIWLDRMNKILFNANPVIVSTRLSSIHSLLLPSFSGLAGSGCLGILSSTTNMYDSPPIDVGRGVGEPKNHRVLWTPRLTIRMNDF